MAAESGAGGASGGVAAVVVNYRAARHLPACLASLRAEGVAEVVVVDNDSGDDSAEVVADADPAAVYLPLGANLGYGAGANRGVEATTAGYVLICNPDLHLLPGAVAPLVDALDSHPEAGIVGPRLLDAHGELYPSARTFPALGDAVGHAFLGLVAPANRWSRRYKMLGWDHTGSAEVDWVSGACFLARRACLDQLGGFDESYFMYSEDVDLCWRAWKAGWKVRYEPAAAVVHVQGQSTNHHPYRMIVQHHRSLMRFANRTTGGLRRLLLPLVAAGLGVRTLLAWGQRLLETARAAGRAE
ncbi:MAG TPA: glycosyltransferase family 2 protein [Acidimicrobiales bacterium]|nr:glycosyltransferase family 2 protein [Acidimicrobiales bacterium]